MADLYVTVPADDIRVQLPMTMSDKTVKFMLRDVETINSVIAQLESIKEMVDDNSKLFV